MKKLVFKKWVSYLLLVLFALGWFIVGAFEWNSFIPYIVGICLMVLTSSLEFIYGRGE